jgi:hypothetical protein
MYHVYKTGQNEKGNGRAQIVMKKDDKDKELSKKSDYVQKHHDTEI